MHLQTKLPLCFVLSIHGMIFCLSLEFLGENRINWSCSIFYAFLLCMHAVHNLVLNLYKTKKLIEYINYWKKN